MKKVNLLFISFITVTVLYSCKDTNIVNPPGGGIAPGIIFSPPYNSPIWHPSGKFIGFNHTPLVSISYPQGQGRIGEQHFNRDSTGFWLINPDGSNMHRIFPYTLLTPSWSPDGQWIAFVAGAQIYKMKFTGTTFDTTTIVQLTFEGRNFFPAWSPDGKWIAYSNTIGDTIGVWISPTDGSMMRNYFTFGAQPYWSKDGESLFYGNRGIWIEKLDHSYKIQIYSDSVNRLGGLNISPDEIKIAFWSNSNIWIMDSTGGNIRQLTTQGVDPSFSWSPDGSSIVYTDYRPNDWMYNNGTLWILNPNTGEKKQLTFNIKPIK